MIECGYGGRILRIDLSRRKFTIESTDPAWMKGVIGGRAANSRRLLEELNPGCDPLGPENLLVFGIGPLTGTILPASAYFTVSAKSPMTGILGDSAAGGQFAAEMKLTGFDQIILSGAADSLIYLVISDQGVTFVPCPHLSQKTINETTSAIRNEQKNPDIEVAAIGAAGENLVSFASIVSSGNRVSGRTGMGAVMGAKKLKAVAVIGSRAIRYYDPLALHRETQMLTQAIQSHREYDKRYSMGTTMLMTDLNGIGILPTDHFRKGLCNYLDDVSGERLAREFKVKNKSCFNCNLHCSRYYVCGDIECEGPEFETLCSFTSRVGNSDIRFALEMNHFLNQTGMDSISTCEVIGWLIECQELGLISSEDVDGLTVSWGDTGAIGKLVRQISQRRGIGDQLAEGATKFSRNFGPEAQKLVMQVKGLDIICGDPRGIKAYGLTYAIASRGADHLRAEPYFELTEEWDVARERFGTDRAADRLSEEGKAALVTYSEKIALLTDCLTMCKNIGLCMDVLNFENAARIILAATGITYSPDSIQETMAESIARDHRLNRRFGLNRDQDTLPDRFTREPLSEGPTSGSVVDIDRMVREYYRLHPEIEED